MRRLTVVTVICAVGLVAPATVGAATRSYSGTFESSGTVGFDVRKKDGKRKVINFSFSNLPLECDGGPNSTSGSVPNFRIKVSKRGNFDADLVSTDPDAEAELNIDGKLKSGGNAEGTVRVHGEDVIVNNPQGDRQPCDSGKTDWTASVVN
jgi:hypothetical protein